MEWCHFSGKNMYLLWYQLTFVVMGTITTLSLKNILNKLFNFFDAFFNFILQLRK